MKFVFGGPAGDVARFASGLLFLVLQTSAPSPARAADGGDGANGNGSGAPTIFNKSPLQGGEGGGSENGTGGKGGSGALVTGSGLSRNNSTIVGGGGGFAEGENAFGGKGGAGTLFEANGAIFVNSGSVVGGYGGSASYFGSGGGADGGVGVSFAGDHVSFVNSGVVVGGSGGGGSSYFFGWLCLAGGGGGDGVHFAGRDATFTNRGKVLGGLGATGFGAGGAGASFAGDNAKFLNYGSVKGGDGAKFFQSSPNAIFYPGPGGAGARFDGRNATFLNFGSVTGGAGADGESGRRGGGDGAYFAGSGARFFNSGSVAGGIGRSDYWDSGNGGHGVEFAGDDATFVNEGVVTGGNGGERGAGGEGVLFSGSYATFFNSGSVTGGAGGGGVGVSFTGGNATFINSGSVAGGGGAAGVAFTGKNASFANSGSVSGGGGGGAGVRFADDSAIFFNSGSVAGGEGGGAGVVFDGREAAFANSGSVTGGVGFYLGGGGGGAYFAGSGARIVNSGSMTGGDAGAGARGGDGAYLSGDDTAVANTGVVTGGKGGDGAGNRVGGDGGQGIVFAGAEARFVNSGSVAGGAGGGGDVDKGGTGGAGAKFQADTAIFINSGSVHGGGGGFADPCYYCGRGGDGGHGVFFAGRNVELINSGSISGGAGGSSWFGSQGGAGAYFAGDGATLVNSGSVAGGRGGGGYAGWNGGYGAFFAGRDATLVNSGSVRGGEGASGLHLGSGGVGVSFAAEGAQAFNSGVIAGGNGSRVEGMDRGSGGVGVDFKGRGGKLTNTGLVSGGDAAPRSHYGAEGGVGIVGADLTIVNYGTISGGLSVDGKTRAAGIVFTGGTNILEIIAGSQILGAVRGTGGDTLRFGGSADGAFDLSALGAQITGFSALEKISGATWTFAGATAAQATFDVRAGTTILNNIVAPGLAARIGDGATLIGAGSIGSLGVADGATLAPGMANALGRLTIAGDLSFGSGSRYIVRISGADVSRAVASGAAALNGALITSFAPGTSWRRSFDLLEAEGGLGGSKFASWSGSFGLPRNFREALTYDDTKVALELTPVLRFDPSLSPNARRVAGALDYSFDAAGALSAAPSHFYELTGRALSEALTRASGEAATGSQQTAFGSATRFLTAMLDTTSTGRGEAVAQGAPLAYAPEPPRGAAQLAFANRLENSSRKAPSVNEARWTGWAAAHGGHRRLGGDATSGGHDLATDAFGVAAGFDYHVDRDVLLGFALAGGESNWSLAQGIGGGRSDELHVGAYGSAKFDAAYLSAAFAFAEHWMSTQRAGPFLAPLSALFQAQSYGGRVEAGYRAVDVTVGLTPYVALAAIGFESPRYHESDASGGGYALSYERRSASDTRAEAGARIDRIIALGPHADLALRSRIAFAHDWVSDPTLRAAFLAAPGAAFTVKGAQPVKDAALISAGAELRIADGATIAIRFDGEFAARSEAYAGTFALRYHW